LSQEPFTQFFVSAVSQSADEMRNVIVRSELGVILVIQVAIFDSSISLFALTSAFE